MIRFGLAHIGNEFGVAKEQWQAELHIQATFTVETEEGVLVSEPHWAVLEQALSLMAWSKLATPTGPDYIYTSVDDEQPGLLTFTNIGPDRWVVGSAWQAFEGRSEYKTSELVAASMQYVSEAIEASRPYMEPALHAQLCSSVCG